MARKTVKSGQKKAPDAAHINSLNSTSVKDETTLEDFVNEDHFIFLNDEQREFIGTFEDYPEYLRLNPYLRTGYRVGFKGWRNVAKTLCWCHNDTVNIWTHLLAALGCLTFCFIIAYLLPTNLTQKVASTPQAALQSTLNQIDSFSQNLTALNVSTKSDDIKRVLHKTEIVAESFLTSAQSVWTAIGFNENNKASLMRMATRLQMLLDQLTEHLEKNPYFQYGIINNAARVNFLKKSIDQISNITRDTTSSHFANGQSLRLSVAHATSSNYLLNSWPAAWPLCVQCLGYFLCFIFSAMYHWMQITDPDWYKLLGKLDYAGVCFLILGSPFPIIIYSFSCEEVELIKWLFLGLVTAFSFISFYVMMGKFFESNDTKRCQQFVFFVHAWSAAAPLLYLLFQKDQSYILGLPEMGLWFLGAGHTFLGSIIYVQMVPERYCANRFDLCGASHQIWHCLTIMGAAIHLYASMKVYNDRLGKVCPVTVLPPLSQH